MLNPLNTYGGSKHFLSVPGGPHHSSPFTSPLTKRNPGALASPQQLHKEDMGHAIIARRMMHSGSPSKYQIGSHLRPIRDSIGQGGHIGTSPAPRERLGSIDAYSPFQRTTPTKSNGATNFYDHNGPHRKPSPTLHGPDRLPSRYMQVEPSHPSGGGGLRRLQPTTRDNHVLEESRFMTP